MSKRFTNEEFQKKLKEVNPTVHTDDEYRGMTTPLSCYCDYGHNWPSNGHYLIYDKLKCPYCSGKKVWIGENDLWTTHPELAAMLENPEDGHKYSKGSNKKVWWICPDCGKRLLRSINDVRRQGFSCPNCSDGISYPNKLIANILMCINVDFTPEYVINNNTKYRYDFYLPEFNICIEANGLQHYQECTLTNRSLAEEQENDRLKMQYAFENGISDYIVIDCSISDINYIKTNLIASKLTDYMQFDNIDWSLCDIKASKSLLIVAAQLYNDGYSTQQIMNELKVGECTVQRWLKKANDACLVKYEGGQGFLQRRKVICVTTKEVFISLREAAKAYDLNDREVYCACSGRQRYAGKYNGLPLVWRYLDQYDEGEQIDLDRLLVSGSAVMINKYTKNDLYVETFNSIAEAEKSCGVNNSHISCCIRGVRKSACGFKWYRADDPNQPDKSKIITSN